MGRKSAQKRNSLLIFIVIVNVWLYIFSFPARTRPISCGDTCKRTAFFCKERLQYSWKPRQTPRVLHWCGSTHRVKHFDLDKQTSFLKVCVACYLSQESWMYISYLVVTSSPRPSNFKGKDGGRCTNALPHPTCIARVGQYLQTIIFQGRRKTSFRYPS